MRKNESDEERSASCDRRSGRGHTRLVDTEKEENVREGVIKYLDGEGLLEVLEEAVSLELVEVAALGALGLVELDGLVHKRPHLLRLLLSKLLRVRHAIAPR
jgi:hypothetical protein